MIKLYGKPQIKGISYKFRPGAYAILPRGNSILLTHQAAQFNEFQLPGGGIDTGEAPIAALHREVFEETGWRIAAPRFLCARRIFIFMPDYDMYAEKLCKFYVAHPVRKLSSPTEDAHTAHWIPKMRVTQFLQGVGAEVFHHYG
jgi:8-oxo-dGTP diphosphatase